jgi:hypothetical protein
MNLPGLLIEYLITGATALLWLLLLFYRAQPDFAAQFRLDRIDPKTFVFLVPLAYVIGMIIDYVSRFVAHALDILIVECAIWPLRRRICARIPDPTSDALGKYDRKSRVYQKLKKLIEPPKEKRARLSQHEVMLVSAELGKQLEVRSSRDRVARGAFFNSIVATGVLYYYYSADAHPPVSSQVILFGGLGLSAVLFAMWRRFARLTDKYLRKAGDAIIQKRNAERPIREARSA